MKNLDKRWLLFLVLILVLATGLPYLSLNQEASTSTEEQVDDVQSMSIALVNEDEGARFNGSELTFGEAFVRSLDNNDNHNWFVVSRGVAESGLNRNTYDMMIVIPNDFSEKALSIDSESPEQVVLNYQINASDDEYIRAEAERTASTILNEFNRRIIDVYFASIIGNLQDAQDNIGEIVEKQTQHTTTYNNDINNPLSNYTNQFGSIKDNTQASRDSFDGLEGLLEGFEDRLSEGADQNQDYLSGLDEFTSVKEGNVNDLLSFSDALLQFDNLLNNQDAEQNLEQLQQANEFINYQLQRFDEDVYGENIVTEINTLRSYLNRVINRVDLANDMLVDRLDGLYDEVAESVSDILSEILKVSEEHERSLARLFEDQDNVEHDNIKERISKLPSLNPNDFEGLPDYIQEDIENVIAVTEKYKREFDEEVEIDEEKIENGLLINRYEKKIINRLKTKGVTISDTVSLPGSEEGSQVFTLDYLPDKYEVKNLKLKYWDEVIYDGGYQEDGIDLDINNTEVDFNVEVTLKLDEEVTNINIFDPVQLGWELHQEGQNEVAGEELEDLITVVPNNTMVASISTNNEELDEEDQENEKEEAEKPEEEINLEENGSKEDQDQTNNQPEYDETNDTSESKNKSDNTGSSNEDSNHTVDDTILPEEDDEDEEEIDDPEIMAVEIVNNRVKHTVTEPVSKMDKATKSLIKVVHNTVKPYQQLTVSFEDYFGRDIEDLNTNWPRLSRLASDNSLHNFLNTDIQEIITGDMVEEVIDGIYKDIEEPLSDFQENVAEFRDGVESTTEEQLERIIQEIRTTREAAQIQNDNLSQILEQVTNWREQSMNLLDQHGVVQSNDMEEQQAILTLNNGFQPLLSESQSIAEQAQGNLNSAESVYQTLDTIDGQADNIEQSGENLVTQADQLSTEMTEKMFEDQEYAENFSDVLANSRVGERQNENLYNFLSNPVQTSNEGTIRSGDNFTPYFLVLTIFIVVLFTAYVISTLHQKRTEQDQFAQEKSLMNTNTPITLITAGIGALEGIAIGVISSYLLQISDGSMVLWTVLITALITGMLLVATYLLRQLKMIGMFVLLIVLSMYLFLTNAFGAGIDGLGHLRAYSPLQYVENILLQAVQGNANFILAILVIAGVIVIGALANLFVLNREEKGDLENEGSTEAS
jgi:type VII secretion EsaA-like protein